MCAGRMLWRPCARGRSLGVVRHDGDVTLRFGVPGIDPKTIDITVDRGFLTVSVKRE